MVEFWFVVHPANDTVYEALRQVLSGRPGFYVIKERRTANVWVSDLISIADANVRRARGSLLRSQPFYNLVNARRNPNARSAGSCVRTERRSALERTSRRRSLPRRRSISCSTLCANRINAANAASVKRPCGASARRVSSHSRSTSVMPSVYSSTSGPTATVCGFSKHCATAGSVELLWCVQEGSRRIVQ